MQRGVLLTRTDAEERTGAVQQIVPEVLAPAHGNLQRAAMAERKYLLCAGFVVFRRRENILLLIEKRQLRLLRQRLRAAEHRRAQRVQIRVMLCAQRQPDLRLRARRAECLLAQLRADDRAERHAGKMRGACQLGQRAQKLSDRKGRISPVFGVSRMRGRAGKPERHTARRAGKRAGSGIDRACGKAGQIVRAVNFSDLLFFKQLAAGIRARTGLFRGLEQQKYVPVQRPSFQRKRHGAQARRMPVVPAEVRRAAVGRGKRVIVCAQRNCRLLRGLLPVRRIEAFAAREDFQTRMRAQKFLQKRLRPCLLPGNFGALVKLLAQIDNQILLLLRHKVLPFQSKKAGRRCFRLPAMSVCSYVFLRCTAGC